jgi:hypothetical protein
MFDWNDQPRRLLGLYATTIFLSASLLFVVQPMAGKMLLPHLGGSSAVWSTAMLFFQTMLMGGYVYAHVLARRLEPTRQILLHGGLIAAAIAISLPFEIPSQLFFEASQYPALWVLVALTSSVGLPLFVVSSSAPLFQHWFAHTDHPDADDPYHLYAASNMGSMIALLGYPFVVEPLIGVDSQTWLWAAGFVVLGGCTAACGGALYRQLEGEADTSSPNTSTISLSWGRRLRWVLYAFVPSSLMLGVTHYATTDLASIPLLWVIPLALYLLTFILVFAQSPVRVPKHLRAAIPVVAFLVLGATFWSIPLYVVVPAHFGLFFLLTLYFHGRLAEDRPDTSQLTQFYIWMSLGGALGGLFNGLIAPAIFDRMFEYTGMIAVGIALIEPDPERIDDPFAPTWAVPAIFLPFAALYLWSLGILEIDAGGSILTSIALLAAGFGLSYWKPRLEHAVAAVILVVGISNYMTTPGAIDYQRSFFGSYTIFERNTGEYGPFRHFSHGTTSHGVQSLHEDLDATPLAYHHPKGPVGQVLEAIPHERVGVMGLGAGAMAAYAETGERFTFYEIDPVVERIARNDFTYLEQCAHRCDVVVGDGRKQIEKVDDDTYDVLFMDAYSSDSVPTHLMTREAFEIYFDKLDDDGVLVLNVSNRYLELEGVVGALAETLGFTARTQLHEPTYEQALKEVYPSEYTVVARDEADLRGLAESDEWEKTRVADVVWTDDYTNIATIVKW